MKTFKMRKSIITILSLACAMLISMSMSAFGVFSANALDLPSPTADQFIMEESAQVSMDGYSILFTAQIDEDYYNSLVEVATNAGKELSFGMEMGPLGDQKKDDVFGSELTFVEGKAKIQGEIAYNNLTGEAIKEMAAVEIVAKAYVECDGARIYTTNSTARSMRGVANMSLVDGDFGENETAKLVLESYLGTIIDGGAKAITEEDTVIIFEKGVTGRLYINAKREDKQLLNATSLDLASYMDCFVDGKLVVSVMGDNAYDVTRVTVELCDTDFSELTYVAFGDSITYGVDGVTSGMMEKPYSTLVSEQLGLASFDNQGVSGATLCANDQGLNNRTQAILSYTNEADIISVLLGVNDYMRGLPLGDESSRDNTTVYGSLFLIAEYLTTNYSDSYVFFMTPFPCRNDSNLNDAGYCLDDVCDAIKYVAGEYGIDVLDLNNVSGYENFVDLGDGLHPSQDYFTEYGAPIITNFIRVNYRAN